MSATTSLRVMLVEDHLAFLLAHEPDLEVVAQAGSLAEAREALLERGLDVAVLDLALPDREGGDLIGELRRSNPGVSVVVLSAARGLADLDEAAEVACAIDPYCSGPLTVERLG